MRELESTRDRPIVEGRTALLVVDVQNGTCRREDEAARPEFHRAATRRVIPNAPEPDAVLLGLGSVVALVVVARRRRARGSRNT